MPRTQSELRHGLVENAASHLICPLCREELVDAMMLSVTTDKAQTIVMPREVRTFTVVPKGLGDGLNGMVLGLSCSHDHHIFLSVVIADGYVTVKTEWDADGSDEVGGDRDGRDGRDA